MRISQQIVDEKKLHPVITIVLNFADKRLGFDTMNDDTTEMKHPEELKELLSVFTGDSSYEKVIPEILERKKKGEVITMCTVAQGLMEKGRTEQFKKDVINSINMLKELNVDE